MNSEVIEIVTVIPALRKFLNETKQDTEMINTMVKNMQNTRYLGTHTWENAKEVHKNGKF